MLVRKFRLLTKEEELEAFNLWKETGDRKAYNLLVESQLRYASLLATRRLNRMGRAGDLYLKDELEAIAWGAVVRAVGVYNPERGRLITLVNWTVQSDLGRRDQGGAISLPQNYSAVKNNPRHLGAYKNAKQQFSIDDISKNGAGRRASDSADKYHPAVEYDLDAALATEEGMAVINKLGDLSDVQKYVLHERFFEQKTLEEIGGVLDLTRERVRQVQVEAIRRLRKHFGVASSKKPYTLKLDES